MEQKMSIKRRTDSTQHSLSKMDNGIENMNKAHCQSTSEHQHFFQDASLRIIL
jgi:hypothetical protein